MHDTFKAQPHNAGYAILGNPLPHNILDKNTKSVIRDTPVIVGRHVALNDLQTELYVLNITRGS